MSQDTLLSRELELVQAHVYRCLSDSTPVPPSGSGGTAVQLSRLLMADWVVSHETSTGMLRSHILAPLAVRVRAGSTTTAAGGTGSTRSVLPLPAREECALLPDVPPARVAIACTGDALSDARAADVPLPAIEAGEVAGGEPAPMEVDEGQGGGGAVGGLQVQRCGATFRLCSGLHSWHCVTCSRRCGTQDLDDWL